MPKLLKTYKISNSSRQNVKAKRKQRKKNRARERKKKRRCEIYIATGQTNQVMRSGDMNACVTFIQE